MRKYWAIFKISWEKSLEYRADFIGHLGMGLINFLVMYFIWSAIFKNRTFFNGYTFSAMMTYVLMTRFLHFVMRGNIGRQIGDEIKEGKISSYLIKPINYTGWWFSTFFAERGYEFFIRMAMLILFFVFFPKIAVFQGLGRFSLFLAFIFISLIFNFIFNILIACLAFWITDVRLIRSAMMIIIDFLAGATIPLDIMPGILRKISNFLPFQFVAYFPIKLYQGALSPGQITTGVSLLFFWIVVLSIIFKYVWLKGVKRYEAVGQ
ncbi:hypothetical protein COS54_00820 [Candidatus Shapirobacteria bacterium CG03_land_8_20_14_0_80_39_12]|uniref:ABC transporter permease n=1 Tax=Candidatus Shapirobacteria bacterium CG03_land_8_20_14_0_80_39_12 TaxID=1974879 RepID=A0A2M7BEL6_9BACT|nr:MAG: hypothetical protein COS54_00820 [Candidatus Shapirobacteria bacterium CG03_land_8_20_14_0_80_39_12]